MHKEGALKMPIVAVNDAKTKNLFDNRYGTGQSTLDGIIRATDMLIRGKDGRRRRIRVVRQRLSHARHGHGCECRRDRDDAIKALVAAMDGFRIMPMTEAAAVGDLFARSRATSMSSPRTAFRLMKDGAIVCNSGHFDVEININDLKKGVGRRGKDGPPKMCRNMSSAANASISWRRDGSSTSRRCRRPPRIGDGHEFFHAGFRLRMACDAEQQTPARRLRCAGRNGKRISPN